MARYFGKSAVFAAAVLLMGGACCGAYQLIAPTDGQAVRENVKIVVPAGVVPDDGFISVLVGEPGSEQFVVALSRGAAKLGAGGELVFYWDSKAPYYESSDPSKPRYFKDGRYPLTVKVFDSTGKMTDSASTTIELKNRVPRTNPAPGVSLVNALSFGQVNHYRVHCDVSVYEVVNRIGLPLLGGMGLSGDALIIQSVEDARPGGQYLIRLRVDEDAWVSSYGVKKYIYADQEFKPQLYRLVDKYGTVITENMFAKQAKYQIMDVLPVLPRHPVKEGDQWADSMTLKIDGITPLIKLKGTAWLDSFEWESGRECAKITSNMASDRPISLANGKIKGTGPLSAQVTTYFAYKTGRMIERNIRLSFDSSISMADLTTEPVESSPPPGMGNLPLGEEQFNEDVYGPGGRPRTTPQPGTGQPAAPGTQPTEDTTSRKKGKAELNIVVRLEK